MRWLARIVRQISTAFGIFAALLVGSAVAVVCQMVVWRYVLGASTVWQTEYVTYALVAATFLGSPYVLAIRGHVNVEVVPELLGPRLRAVLAFVADLLGLVFCSVLFWQATEYWLEVWRAGWTTETVWALPLWIPTLPLMVGSGLLTAQYLVELVERAMPARGELQR